MRGGFVLTRGGAQPAGWKLPLPRVAFLLSAPRIISRRLPARRYLNDHQCSEFYQALGMQTTTFNRHVIIETNNTCERIFPQVRRVRGLGCTVSAQMHCWGKAAG